MLWNVLCAYCGYCSQTFFCSGGTTIAAIHALEKGGFRGTVIDAVVAATERSKEMSQVAKL